MSAGRKVLIPLMVFLVVFITHNTGSKVHPGVGDTRWMFPVALSILGEGNTNLDEYRERIEYERATNLVEVDGSFYNLFPLGPSLLVLPFAYVRILHSSSFPPDFDSYKDRSFTRRQREAASLIVALASVFMYLIAVRSIRSIPLSLLAVFIFAFCTSNWSTVSRLLWQHGPSILMLTIALYLIVRYGEGFIGIPLSGFFLALAYIMRPTNAFPVVVFGLFVLIRHRRLFIPWILCALPVAVFFVSYNLSIYDSLLPPYYQGGRLHGNRFWEALAGSMISPNRGLLVFTPVLLLSIFGVAVKIRKKSFSLLDGCLAALVVIHWIAGSLYDHWWCGYSYGPRFFADMIPYFVYLLLPALEGIKGAQGAKRVCLASLAGVLILFSFAVHFRGARHISTAMWNTRPTDVDEHPERVWDWGDLQFLRTEEDY